MEAHTYCACCVQRTRCERGRGFYVVPMPVLVEQYEHYEPQPLYYHHHHQGSQAWRARWLRRVEEEEISEAPFQRRQKRVDACRSSKGKGKEKEKQEKLLQTLMERLEALEMGMKCLARAQNGSTLPQKPQRRSRGRCVARSNPAADGSPTGGAEAYQGALMRRFSEERRPMNSEEAAVVIQSRFRAYLVRRSQSLRHLRHLAMLKMSLRELKALFSDVRFKRLMSRDADERNSFSEKATALLLEVDSVQGSDMLVREARRSLSKELVTLLDSLDDMGGQSAAVTKSSVQAREDMLVNDRVKMSSDCFDCSGEAPMSHSESMTEEEEEEFFIQEANDGRVYASDRDHFTCVRNRNGHGPKHSRPADFNMPRFANGKNGRRRFGFPEMADFRYDCSDFPF
ncbi:hypothetical protein SUGI_0334650 [Cryptomeria japonica]|uniref:BAG family molecular chaperone regulator 7 n=1 Tax=Cryptomeria japonica TaxID=3369 RepID=UPI002408A1A3|nr:BAG family molecular chaperone regulator 7 [Cryptomeria japonica]GLJ18749.1 hypothetical protein SUGI_0334650 [Cryptomeria japonica]